MLLQEFVETKLQTRFADFKIRVYRDDFGKETLVLYTEPLDLTQPVLVRVHSECITGDTFGSLKCDCGKQLAKSLHIISEEGGVLIYLRQEGRGIGLFEKIKSYQLQAKGYDTFEANVLLGHRPDQRSYEMAKVILDDLGVKQVRLLTNNPSKVSDLAKLGIRVVERVPLISRSNKHNKTYLDTKKKKFHHLLGKSHQPYFYQFQLGSAEQLDDLIEIIKDNKRDPLLKIGIGIAANHDCLDNKSDIQRIQAIIRSCEKQPELTPILHFSFSRSKSPLEDAKKIKKLWPLISRIQLNDLASLDLATLKAMAELFVLHIPLPDEHFKAVHNQKFRDFVSKSNSFVILDNSKGKGLKENAESFIKKIDILLNYGLNDIGLCGGFGPDHLDTYFQLRKYYRISFSIDAESKLKTSGLFDSAKTESYLLQLFHFDNSTDCQLL